LLLVLALIGPIACRSPQRQRWTENDGGVTRWIGTAEDRLKTRVYSGTVKSESPVLVLVLHGDVPEPPPSYQYEFAKVVAERNPAVVAVGVLRPGYRDPTGDQSSGDMGRAIADNYTAEVVDAVAGATRQLANEYAARAIVLVGHSGGAAIVANVLGRHRDLARAAVLVGCGCDPSAWRARQRARTGNPMFDGPTRSILPLDIAKDVAPGTIVSMIVGAKDDVAPPADSQAYANTLRQRGIDVSVEVVPGLGHNILFAPQVFDALATILKGL
jgi:predicted esterase